MIVNIDFKYLGDTVQAIMDIQGENQRFQVTGQGPTLYEALGRCFAQLMHDKISAEKAIEREANGEGESANAKGEEEVEKELKVTWVYCKPGVEEWTIIQELENGHPTNVRWGTNLFADLFQPVYQYLKEL